VDKATAKVAIVIDNFKVILFHPMKAKLLTAWLATS
jgi:hypothetical protein